jgi:hypothetical protein
LNDKARSGIRGGLFGALVRKNLSKLRASISLIASNFLKRPFALEQFQQINVSGRNCLSHFDSLL